MLRSRTSSRFATLCNPRALSVTGFVAAGARGAVRLGLPIAASSVATLMSRVTRSSCDVVPVQTRPVDLCRCRGLAEPATRRSRPQVTAGRLDRPPIRLTHSVIAHPPHLHRTRAEYAGCAGRATDPTGPVNVRD